MSVRLCMKVTKGALVSTTDVVAEDLTSPQDSEQ